MTGHAEVRESCRRSPGGLGRRRRDAPAGPAAGASPYLPFDVLEVVTVGVPLTDRAVNDHVKRANPCWSAALIRVKSPPENKVLPLEVGRTLPGCCSRSGSRPLLARPCGAEPPSAIGAPEPGGSRTRAWSRARLRHRCCRSAR